MAILPVGISGEAEYQISRSLRFNSADSAYLNRTPGSAGNQQKWTWSGWVKRSAFGAKQLFGAGAGTVGSPECFIGFEDNFNFQIFDGTNNLAVVRSTAVYRDPSAYYHAVVAIDTTQATASNRVLMYINGQQITAFTLSTYPSQNLNTQVNATTAHRISSSTRTGGAYFDGYLTEVNFIDGQALTPSSFGETDPITGVWRPKKYTGTYGTNGFYLNFSDNSGTTSTTLGKDSSGNGNNWTPNNFSVTAGAGNDSLVDVPTRWGSDTGAGGEVRGNYATLNPLDKDANISVSNGNLYMSTAANGNQQIRATIALPTSGKWYWETTNSGSVNNFNAGITQLTASLSVEGVGDLLYNEGGVINNNGSTTSGFATLALGDVMGLAYDADANKLYFYKNNTLVNSGGTTPAANGPFAPMFGMFSTNNAQNVNFGQRPFAYTAPSGFKALCTTNIPEGTITTSGSFTGNAAADGPFVYLNGVPTAMTINGNAVTFGTHADKLANGFKVRSSSSSYNASGSNTYSITTTGAKFKYANAQGNP